MTAGAAVAGPASAKPTTPAPGPDTRPVPVAIDGDPWDAGSGDATAAVDPFGGAPAPADLPTSAPSADGPTNQAPAGAEPTIQYEEALAHAADPDTFTPGERVSVGYAPRADDGWAVDGTSPRPLPAGNTTGRMMATARQGSLWSSRPPADLADPSAAGDGGIGTSAGSAGGSGTGPAGGSTWRPIAGQPLVAAGPGTAVDGASAATARLRRQVFGFLPYWTLGDSTTVLNYYDLSTIAYFSVGADRNGNLLKRNANGTTTTGWGGWTSTRMTSVIDSAHAHHTRVVLTISVFAWTTGEAAKQGALLGNPAARRNLARQAAAAVRDRGADGVNLDFEPIASGHAADFTAFVRTVRAELDRVHRGYQLTFDTTGWIGNYPIEDATARGGADAIFIMGYDYRGSGASTAGSIDPLTGPGYSLDDTIRAYTARVPASKLILGLPYYGRAWSTTTGSLRAPNQSGSRYGTSNAVMYSDAAALVRVYGRHYDATEGVTWFSYRRRTCTGTYGCVTSWRQVYFDDAQSLKARYDLVVRSRLRGAGIWALGYDGRDPSLYGAISLKFLHDTTPPEAGIVAMPASTGDAGFVVAWRAADDSAIRSYDVQVSVDGGAWANWWSGTRATSDVYLGADGHGYAFRVRATDAYGNVGAWDVAARYAPTPKLAIGGFGRVRVDGISARVSPDTSALKVATLSAGQVLAIIGGPVSADGYTWYEVTGPLSEWNTVAFTRSGIWVAARSASTSFVAAAQAPGATRIDAGIDGLRIGTGGPASVASFSPNGDHSGDTLHLAWRNNVALAAITLRAYRLNGSLIGTRVLGRTGAGSQSYDWDGALAGIGRPVDGRYVLQLVGTAGAKTYSAPSARPVTLLQIARYSVVFDRMAPAVAGAGSTGNRISPNGDGRFETLAFGLATTGGSAWDLSVARLAGATAGPPIRAGAGTGNRARFTWNGRDDRGAVVPDGTYRVTLRVADPAGNRTARAWTVIVDAHPAVIAATATPTAPTPLSPNGDGAADSAVLHWASNEPVSGTVSIRRGTRSVRGWTFAGRTGGTISWNGRDAKGHAVPDGTYRVRVDGFDATGNRTTVERIVVVDRTAGFLRWAASAFDPQDGDRLLPTSRLTFRTTRSSTVSLAIVDARGVVVRTVWVARSLAAGVHGWTWDGRGVGGAFVAPGAYTAVLTVRSPFGTTTLRRAVFAGAYRIAPLATTLKAGTTLTLTFRAVEPLRGRPVVTFRQTGLAPVTRTATRLRDGSYRVTFPVRPGKGPASVVIAATDTGGHADRQTLALVVR